MRAFVLSGGGNLGPLQVGALRALLEQSIQPQMIVGCSAGALNAVTFARNPTLEALPEMEQNWRDTTLSDVYPGNRLQAFMRLFTGKDSLYDNRRFYALMQNRGLTPAHTFANLPQLPLYITATVLATGRLHVFGDDPNDRILDATMASTALTPMHPPWEVDGVRYVDGGTVTPLPLRVALERGATEIWALHITERDQKIAERSLQPGVTGVVTRSVDAMLRMQAEHDLLLARNANVRLHYLPLMSPGNYKLTDFGHVDDLIAAGYEQGVAAVAERESDSPVWLPVPLSRLRRATSNLATWLSPRGGLHGVPLSQREK